MNKSYFQLFWVPRSMITGSYKNIFSVIRNFPNCLLFCIPTKKNESSCGSTSSPAVRGVSVPDFGLSNRCVVVTL